jgi:L-seryl-tRNA(Ser) seleniumtransferase
MDDLSSLPSIDKLLRSETGKNLAGSFGHELTVVTYREVLDRIRDSYLKHETEFPPEEEIHRSSRNILLEKVSHSLIPVVNATGVIIHTNLGRAPLSLDTRKTIAKVSGGYSNLEFDLESGQRGSRLVHAEKLFKEYLGVEAALVVNNNAAAVLLMLTVLTQGKKVIISRSQLVEIGGGFRIPDVLRHSGTDLVEVGTTNKVHLFDYQNALGEDTVAVMRAHPSNFSIVGFTSEPEIEELINLTHKAGLHFFDDLGSGALLDTTEYGLKPEPMVQESIRAGADLISFSGDKLLGGPQAGIILGKKELISQLKTHPLARAIRADKLALAGLSATMTHYLKGEELETIPVWQMISAPVERLEGRVKNWIKETGVGEVEDSKSMIGGGSLPGETLPTKVWSLESENPDRLAKALRTSNPPVIARIDQDRLMLDPRTVLPEQDSVIVEKIKAVWSKNEK